MNEFREGTYPVILKKFPICRVSRLGGVQTLCIFRQKTWGETMAIPTS